MKLRKTKRLTSIVVACALVLAVGAAFAFTPGILDIVGNVNVVGQDYLVWADVEVEESLVPPPEGIIDPRAFPLAAFQQAEIEDARGRTDQRIVWDMWIWGLHEGDGEVFGWGSITALVENNSPRFDAILNGLNITVLDINGDEIDAEELGLTVVVWEEADLADGIEIAAGTQSQWLTFDIEWVNVDGLEVITGDDGWAALATVIIELDYTVA